MSIVENWSTAVIELRLHGYPSVAVDGRPVALTLRHAFALLARLADARGRLSRAALAALLWPGVPLDTARTRLRRLVHELNRRLKLDALTGDADALWLDATRIRLDCDVLHVRQLARRLLRGETLPPAEAAPLLEPDAAQWLEGFSLGGDAFDDWLDATRREHAALVARALQQLALRWLDDGRLGCAQAAAERLVRLEPCSEAAYACLIAARAERGDAAGVETAYFECAAALRHELGIKPSPLLERAYQAAVARCREADDAVLARLLDRLAPAQAGQRTPAGRRAPTMAASASLTTDLC
jgi:DNA-binding SARP family transcriptional activator